MKKPPVRPPASASSLQPKLVASEYAKATERSSETASPPPPTRERQHAFHQDSAAYAAAFGDLPSATGDGDVTMADAPPSDAHKARVRAILEGVGFKPPRAPR